MNAKPSKKHSETNWEQVDSLSDSGIDTSNIPPLDAEFFKNATLRMPQRKSSITMRLDSDLLAWFRSLGKGYQTRMNAILRAYMEAQQHNQRVKPAPGKSGGASR